MVGCQDEPSVDDASLKRFGCYSQEVVHVLGNDRALFSLSGREDYLIQLSTEIRPFSDSSHIKAALA